MSKENNWRHYHLERNGNSQGLHFQRYRRAWELIASLARTSPRDTWRVLEMLGDSLLRATTKGGHRMTTAPVTAEEKAERAELRT